MLWRVTEEALRLRNQQYSDEGCNLSSLREPESILQTLATGDRDSEAFSTLESELNNEHSVHSNYQSSHDTPDDPEADDSEHTPTPEPETPLPIILDQQSKEKNDHVPTPPVDQQSMKKNNRILTPPVDQQSKEKNDRIPTPPSDRRAEKKEDQVPTPPSAQPFKENTMLYPYSKYQDDPNVEAHVYAFLQTWEANLVSQQPTDVESKRSKIAAFGMTLEGPATGWHAKHLSGSFSTFEALKTKFLQLFHR